MLWDRIFIWTLCIIMKNQFIEEMLENLQNKVDELLDEVETMNNTKTNNDRGTRRYVFPGLKMVNADENPRRRAVRRGRGTGVRQPGPRDE